jgi:hypothetical protein
MWGARGSFPPAADMVVMVAFGSWSLGHSSTVGIVYVFYGINLFFGINIYAGINHSPCLDRADKIYSIHKYSRFILGLFQINFISIMAVVVTHY